MIKLYIAFMTALIIGRLIYIIASLIAASRRKKNCISSVAAKYAKPPVLNNKVIYTYEYEGESFCIIYANGIPESSVSMYVSIDPDAPDKYYLHTMTTQNIEKLKNYFKTILNLLLITSSLWIPLVWIIVISPLLNKQW
ncbi:MAG: hypothetical protein K6A79_04050 [Ruminococcus sp.]|nr:hypothetical protein [Ruminococcus sp.]